MTTEQQKLALLEWAGVKRIPERPNPGSAGGKLPEQWHYGNLTTYWPPNLDSLDILATFEEKLEKQDGLLCIDYVNHLLELPNGGTASRYGLVHATAPMKVAALIRTLGLWREEE